MDLRVPVSHVAHLGTRTVNGENGEIRLSSISIEGNWESGIMWPRALPRLMSRPTRYLMLSAKRASRGLGAPFGYAPYPPVIFLVVNNRCNLLCRMCDVGWANLNGQQPGQTDSTFSRNLMTNEQLEIKDWVRLIDDVARFKPLIAITSTEPLLYNDIVELIHHCHKMGLKVQVTTNGFLLERFVEPFLRNRLDILSVSIDGPADVHDRIRGVKGAFEKAMKAIDQIMNRREGEAPLVEINYTICDLNFDKLVETLSCVKCDRLMFSHLNFVTEEMMRLHNARCKYPVTPSGLRGVRLEAIDLDRLWSQTQQVKASQTAFPVKFSPELSRQELEVFYRKPLQFLNGHMRCNAIWSAGQILADGSLTGSTRCFDTARLGNIRDQAFTKLWNGPTMREFRKYLRQAGGAFPACSRCCGLL